MWWNCFRSVVGILFVIISLVMLLYIPDFKEVFNTATTTFSATTSDNITNSPSFPNQEILDNRTDWIDLKTRNYTTAGDRTTDIESVDYFSDGNNLGAILWLYFPVRPQPNPINEEVDYGMYIDADFDDKTGYGGIEYKIEISWDNETKEWRKVLEKWSHYGESLTVQNQTIPFANFSKEGEHYVVLSADLDAMLSPKRYKAIFYGEVRREGSLRTDFTRWVAIPPLELTLSSSPNSVDLRKGEEKTIEVKVNTTQGYEPTVNLNATSHSKNIILDFTQNDTINVPVFTLRIPSYGIATIPLTITSSKDASIGPYTLFIFANSSFPAEEFIEPKAFTQKRTSSGPIPTSITSENIFTESTLLVTLEDPLTLIDHISDFWNKVGGPMSFIYGILAGISPWLYTRIKERRKEGNNKNSRK
jgi:hypothetical protein